MIDYQKFCNFFIAKYLVRHVTKVCLAVYLFNLEYKFKEEANKLHNLNTMPMLSLRWEATAACRIPNHPDGIRGKKMKATAAKL